MLSPARLTQLEQQVQRALRRGDTRGLDVLGFGEISTVLRVDGDGGPIACKRLIPYRERAAAERAASAIADYVTALGDHGLNVVDTEVCTIAIDGSFCVYCLQPALPGPCIGPAHLAALDKARTVSACERIFELLRRAVTPRLAPDGQLSNWAFIDEELVYLDVSSPFMRDERGRQLFDFTHMLGVLPLPIRAGAQMFALKPTLDGYHHLRGQALDFLGNLYKERLERHIEALLPSANRLVAPGEPITAEEVRRHYRNDALLYASMQLAARARSWLQRKRGHTPNHLPKPTIDRNL